MITKTNSSRASQTNGGTTEYSSPTVNLSESKDAYLLEAEMPGVNKEGLDVLLEDNELTIVGHRQPETLNAELVYRESKPRDFRRVFVLDPSIDTKRISAQIDQGVLRLNLPKAERVKPRKIEVAD
jgi:HSP20 family protein